MVVDHFIHSEYQQSARARHVRCGILSELKEGGAQAVEKVREDMEQERQQALEEDVAQPDQARIVAINAQYFLKTGGHFVISIKANCIDSTVPAEAVFASEIKKLKEAKFRPKEQLTLEPYERDHAVVIGEYRTKKKKKKD